MGRTAGNDGTLLAVVHTGGHVASLFSLIGSSKRSSVMILGSDFAPWIELRRRNIRYKTPAQYFDRTKCEKIDIKAISLAREWYKTLNDRITYQGISIGQMEEYNFAHLFIGALRDVQIANSVINIEKPNEILLPRAIPLGTPNAVRYETLAKAMACVARSEGIHVLYYASDYEVTSGRQKIKPLIKSVLRAPRRVAAETLSRIRSSRCKNAIVFIDVPSATFLPIKKELERNCENAAIGINAYRRLRKKKRGLAGKANEMIETWNCIRGDQDFRNKLIYENVSLVDVLEERFYRFFSDESILLIEYIEGTDTFVRDAKPKLIVVQEDVSPIHRTIVRVCKMRGIQTLVIQHGATGADMERFHVMPVEADKQAVWGSTSRDWAIKRGKSPETQVVTGNPMYDSKSRPGRLEEEEIGALNRLGLSNSKGIVVIATTWYQVCTSSYTPEDDETFIRKTLEAMKEFPEKQVVVKLHPTLHMDYDQLTRAIINELLIGNVVVTKCLLWELLGVCDLLITSMSTVGLEAMLLDKPVITFDPIGTMNPYAETDAVIGVRKENDLVAAIKGALYDPEVRRKLSEARRKFVYEYAYLQDGKASQRVANLIEKMIGY